MKLLIATHSLAGLAGAPLHTFDLCRGFRRAGHDVSAFTFYPGIVADMLEREGFRVFSPRNYNALDREKESLDLVYLHHATCEALLGLMFAGRVPIVRGYIGIYSRNGKPVNGDFTAAATYLSEEVKETMNAVDGYDAKIPAIISRNVYDEQEVAHGAALGRRPSDKPNFAVVSNHLAPELAKLLEKAAKERLCHFTHFGHPHNSAHITAKLLTSFDAVITIGRTVLLAAALGRPVYICDIRGADGWLNREIYYRSQHRNFSGRLFAIKDWNLVQQHLLDTSQWPSVEDLTWLCEQVERDHALSRRIEELESFFTGVIEKAPPPVPVPDGYRAVFNLINDKEEGTQRAPGQRSRRRDLAKALKTAEEEAEALSSRVRQLERRLQKQKERTRRLELQIQNERDPGTGLSRITRYVWSKVSGR